MKDNRIDLLQGSILSALLRLLLPILATSFLQMTYNIVDMIWMGHVSSDSVAAIGAAGMFINLANGFTAFLRVGTQVTVAQAYGSGDRDRAAGHAQSALQMGAVFAAVYAVTVCFCRRPFIAFFRFTKPNVVRDAEIYLLITGVCILFHVLNPICTAMITATGNSRTPFRINAVGLVINLILDPVLIFGVGPVPALGVVGAASATIFAHFVVFVLYVRHLRRDPHVFSRIRVFGKPRREWAAPIVRIGLPATVQSVAFNAISMTIGRIIAAWGETAIAVQKVGIQVEALSYMAADAFAAATNSFMAQNYGAGQLRRARRGYGTALCVMTGWGVITTLLLVLFPAPIFRIFIPEAGTIALGVNYLRILGWSQLFMCLEILTASSFASFGKTIPPSVVSILFTALRIPLALILERTELGLNGVWWSISLSSMMKGIILVILFRIFMRHFSGKPVRNDFRLRES